MSFLHLLINLYVIVLFVTALMSWVPITSSEGGIASLRRVLSRLTEPVLRPLRAALPRLSLGGVGIDLSVFIAIIILLIINNLI